MERSPKQLSTVAREAYRPGIYPGTNTHVHSYDLNNASIAAIEFPHILRQIENIENSKPEEAQLKIYMDNSSIGQKGCLSLSKAYLPRLRQLRLIGNNIGDEGCRWFAKGRWDSLQALNLFGNGITEKGCGHLSQANWNKLTWLNLYGNTIGRQGYLRVISGCPLGCQVYCRDAYRQE